MDTFFKGTKVTHITRETNLHSTQHYHHKLRVSCRGYQKQSHNSSLEREYPGWLMRHQAVYIINKCTFSSCKINSNKNGYYCYYCLLTIIKNGHYCNTKQHYLGSE